ncbi:MAG: hypothetical protein MZU91_06625 [Desulfosudis oleivorans]|nr:hypothetical protein [Desulfosudis oleivorans]
MPGHRACIGCGEVLAVRPGMQGAGQRYDHCQRHRLHGDCFIAASHHQLECAVDSRACLRTPPRLPRALNQGLKRHAGARGEVPAQDDDGCGHGRRRRDL